MLITSAANDKIKHVKKLIKSSKERNAEAVYIVEGIRMVKEIPDEDMISLFVSEKMEGKYKDVLTGFSEEKKYLVKDFIFEAMSDTGAPQGILAVVRMKRWSLQDLLAGENTFILVAEHLQDPGNLGTIIRSAEAAGASGILLSKDSVDLYNPKVVRSTMGAMLRVPICISEDLLQDIDYIKSKGVKVYGAHLNGKPFYEKNFREPCAFLIGNEGNGLSEAVSATADDLLRIPMKGKVESLNAATSTSVIAYEVLRQREYTL